MRKFTNKGPRIAQLSLEAKLIYTVFCLMALAGLALSVVYYYEIVGSSSIEGVEQYYAGSSSSAHAGDAPKRVPALEGGPTLDLPDDDEDRAAPTPRRGVLIVRISRRKLLEVTHFHLFTVPVFLLIICHLFMLCRVRAALKFTILITGLGSTTLHLIAPWLIYWGGGPWAWTMPLSGALMGVSMALMTVWTCVAMWREQPAKNA